MAFTGTLVSIDSGSSQSGIVVLNGLKIAYADNISNDEVIDRIIGEKITDRNVKVLIEDIKPSGIRLMQPTIDTCKFIGVLCNTLEKNDICYELITRNEVKLWAFNTYPYIVLERINKKIEYKNKRNNDGKLRRPSFVYVDDRIIIAVMKEHWNIGTPKPGKRNGHGLSRHSWQALGVASCYLAKR